MDIKIEKKPWYWRYRYYLLAGVGVLALIAYAAYVSFGSTKSHIDGEQLDVATVEDGSFIEYVDVEGIVQPILTIKINTVEDGFVERIVAEDGSILSTGDTILVLTNPELMKFINDEEDEFLRQQRLIREQEIEMNQKTLTLQQQALDADYELQNLENKMRIAREEFEMGMKSKAEIDLAESEYAYLKKKTELKMRGLNHDSTAAVLKIEMLNGDMTRAQIKKERALDRKANLIVRAPADGQLGFLSVTPGQKVQQGACIGELKVLSGYKIHAFVNEYYVDRIAIGLQGNIKQQRDQYPLIVTRVIPEIKDKNFEVDLTFTDQKPSSVRIGKSYRVQIELGQPEKAVVIPNGDFYSKTKGKWIYKLNKDGSKAVKTNITLGRQNPRQFEVLSGLNPGDRIIAGGYDRFDDVEEIIIQ